MQILIELSKDDWSILKPDSKKIGMDYLFDKAIELPEHHGRLGDLDKLYTEMNNGIKAGMYEDGYENYGHINDMDDCLECVKYADTIIKASKHHRGE